MESTNHILFTVRNITFSSNTYLLKNKANNHCLIIDPGLDADLIDNEIILQNLRPIAIISTHGHFDHIGTVSFFKLKYNIPFYLHEADLKISRAANFYLKMGKLNLTIETPTPDFLFKGHFEKIYIDEFNLDIYNLPGHSPGSCVIKIDQFLFSGDILYKNGLGAGSIPREDKTLLRQSILKIFDIFANKDLILPGHGAPEYVELIKKNNIELNNFLLENNE